MNRCEKSNVSFTGWIAVWRESRGVVHLTPCHLALLFLRRPWYMKNMNHTVLDRFLRPFTECLTPEVAQRIVNLQLDSQSQSRLDELAAKANEGQLTDDERQEYEEFVEGIDLIGILKARARTVLVQSMSQS
jgi:hypothetical protein